MYARGCVSKQTLRSAQYTAAVVCTVVLNRARFPVEFVEREAFFFLAGFIVLLRR